MRYKFYERLLQNIADEFIINILDTYINENEKQFIGCALHKDLGECRRIANLFLDSLNEQNESDEWSQAWKKAMNAKDFLEIFGNG